MGNLAETKYVVSVKYKAGKVMRRKEFIFDTLKEAEHQKVYLLSKKKKIFVTINEITKEKPCVCRGCGELYYLAKLKPDVLVEGYCCLACIVGMGKAFRKLTSGKENNQMILEKYGAIGHVPLEVDATDK